MEAVDTVLQSMKILKQNDAITSPKVCFWQPK